MSTEKKKSGFVRFIPYIILFLFFALYTAGFLYRTHLKKHKQKPTSPFEVLITKPKYR